MKDTRHTKGSTIVTRQAIDYIKRKQSEARLPRPEKDINTYSGVFGPEEIDGFRSALFIKEEASAEQYIKDHFDKKRRSHEM
jgi:hypothetical protein